MTDDAFDTLALYGRHIPDSTSEKAPDGSVTITELPGFYQVGFKVGDAFFPLTTFKAGEILAAKAAVAEAGDAAAASSSQTEPSVPQ